MEILFFFFIIIVTVSISSMLFPSHDYPRAFPRRRRQRRLQERKDRHDEDDEKDNEAPKRRSGRSSRGKRRNTQERRVAHSERGNKRTIHNIIEDDIIEIPHLNKDFIVESQQTMKEKSWSWKEYTLADGDEMFSLSVADEGKEIYLSQRIDDLDVGYPPPEEVTYEDQTYKLVASGRAESGSGRYKYFTYEGPDEFALMLEDWEGEVEYYLGERLHERDINILPGSSS